ncbi:MAG: DUF4147 domain-containing protein [Dorea sp.]|nr:DUF4147 domain-containing protein [Dorea sp.]
MDANPKIRNYNDLIRHGDCDSRIKILNLMNQVLETVDAGRQIKKIMRLSGNILIVGNRRWDLNRKKNIYLLGAGKACNAMSEAVCSILKERITKGIISVKISEPQDKYINTDVYIGGHPLPNEEGLEAAKAMLELIAGADKDDLFISVCSGGSSALLTYPVEGITLKDEIAAQKALLESGAGIEEINAVRRHISRTNGGRLAQRIAERGAEHISIMVCDAVDMGPTKNPEEPVELWGTPFALDSTTVKDARDMISNYNLYHSLPAAVTDYLWDDSRVEETPKKMADTLTSYSVGTVADSCEAAVCAAKRMNMPVIVLSTSMEGESREAGYVLSSIAREIKFLNRPVEPPCFVVCSGETTTCIDNEPAGKGGPSHELVLGLSVGIQDIPGLAAASIDTEGTDGTTLFAGGIVDGYTISRLTQSGHNIYEVLRNHRSGDVLYELSDSIFTGNTGTNLCDFNVLYIS